MHSGKLGITYYMGLLGVPIDIEKAAKYWKLAATAGDQLAKDALKHIGYL